MFINGERAWARSGATFAAIDPATAETFAVVASGDKADVDAAVASGRAAFTGGWAGLPPVRRVRILNRIAGLLRERSREFAELESLDVGKPLRQAEDDVAAAAGYFEFFAGVADKVFGSSIPLGQGFVDFTLREPLGISAQIVPWNYPLRLASRGIAPALAAGNAVIAKPAAEAGLSIARLAELAFEAGIPAGVFNVVTGGRETGAALASHPGINHITFTGSVPTGIAIMKAAADNVVPVTLELGGKSPNVVFADADLERAAASSASTLMQNAAQTCTAPTRLLLERSAHDRFVDLLAKRIGAIRLGRGRDNPDMGPVVSERQMKRVLGYIEAGSRDGATAGTGGARAALPGPAGRGNGGHRRRPLAAPRTGGRLLHRANLAGSGGARIRPGAGGDLRPGANGHDLRVARRGDRHRQRHALWTGHGRLDQRPQQGDDRGHRRQVRPGAGQWLQRGRKHRFTVWRLQAQRFWPGAGCRSAGELHADQEHHDQLRIQLMPTDACGRGHAPIRRAWDGRALAARGPDFVRPGLCFVHPRSGSASWPARGWRATRAVAMFAS